MNLKNLFIVFCFVPFTLSAKGGLTNQGEAVFTWKGVVPSATSGLSSKVKAPDNIINTAKFISNIHTSTLFSLNTSLKEKHDSIEITYIISPKI